MTVVFGSQSPTPTNLTPTTFDVAVGPQPEGTVTVSVTRVNGKSDASTYDFFFLVPSISSFSPDRLDNGEAGTVTVTGQNFLSGMTVNFGSQSPLPTAITATSFDVFVAGTEPPGFASVRVTLPNGKDAMNSTGFEVLAGSPRVIFTTSDTYNGDLGGLAGADATCQTLASNAGLPGTFQAWLADSTQSPSTRESQVGTPYWRVDETVIANDWADLTDGSIASSISLDENGVSVVGSAAWSNVAAIGAGPVGGSHCVDWTIGLNTNPGRVGSPTSTVGTWSDGAGTLCHAPQHLYCVEQ